MKNYYTAGEYKELLKHLTIVATTNEQVNNHILDWFSSKGIAFESRSLKTGDYCFKITACPELGFSTDTYFTDELFIERKNSLNELAGSINSEAFHYELKRARPIEHKYLLVEQQSGWQGIITHDYGSKYNPKSYWSTLHTFEVQYGLKIKFIDKSQMGLEIYSICKAVLDSKIITSSV